MLYLLILFQTFTFFKHVKSSYGSISIASGALMMQSIDCCSESSAE